MGLVDLGKLTKQAEARLQTTLRPTPPLDVSPQGIQGHAWFACDCATGREAARVQEARQALLGLRPGIGVHIVSDASWGAYDALAGMSDRLGPSDLWLATWCISPRPADRLIQRLERGAFLSVQGVVDSQNKKVRAGVIEKLRAAGCLLEYVKIHAKAWVLLPTSGEPGVVCLSSANMTVNPRIETFQVYQIPEVVAFHKGWIEERWQNARDKRG